MTSNREEMLSAALEYAAKGWAVFPCHTPTGSGGCSCGDAGCEDQGKHPRTTHGVLDATTDAAAIRQWWQRWPQANIGIATGAKSGMVVVDVDSYKGGDEALATLLENYTPLPNTVQQLTGGGGYHLLFTHPGVAIRNSVSDTLGYGLDVRGDGGYIIAAPSRHVSGRLYAWELSHDPDDTAISSMPQWLISLLQAPPKREPSVRYDTTPLYKGERNTTLFRLGASLRARGLEEDEIDAALQVANTKRCQPPLSQKEVRKIAKSDASYPIGMPQHTDGVSLTGDTSDQKPYIPPAHTDTALAPPLPRALHFDERLYATIAPWISAYVDHSARWSPRAASSFHQGVALWVLSTVAARRIAVEMGHPVFPIMLMAMVAASTRFAKTTTAKLGLAALRDAGCAHLLAADRSTPQALLRSMSGAVPSTYGRMNEEDKAEMQKRVRFAGQRGWFFEEWGGLLAQMARKDSTMADFHALIRVLDDGYEDFRSDTIQRGLERIKHPYLALLANATPYDLGKFMAPGSAWWHDGFWPRFAFLTPGIDELPSLGRRPMGSARIPSSLIAQLHTWHASLGEPKAEFTEELDHRDKPTGQWIATITPQSPRFLRVREAVYNAYYDYNDALLTIAQDSLPADLSSCYGRFHDKALRIATLMASFAGHDEITMPYWAYAQSVAEQWRTNLHALLEHVRNAIPASLMEQKEERIESQLVRKGAMSARELCRVLNMSATEMAQLLPAMERTGRIMGYTEGKSKLFAVPADNLPNPTPLDNEEKEPF